VKLDAGGLKSSIFSREALHFQTLRVAELVELSRHSGVRRRRRRRTSALVSPTQHGGAGWRAGRGSHATKVAHTLPSGSHATEASALRQNLADRTGRAAPRMRSGGVPSVLIEGVAVNRLIGVRPPETEGKGRTRHACGDARRGPQAAAPAVVVDGAGCDEPSSHGIPDPFIEFGDSLLYPRFIEGGRLKRFDAVLINPSWNQDGYGEET